MPPQMAGRGQSGKMVTGMRSASPGDSKRIFPLPVINSSSVLGLYFLFLIAVLPDASSAYNTTFVQQDINGECWQHVSHKGGKIFSHAGHGRYADNADCKVTVVTDPGKRIHAVFESFDVTDSVNCYQDEVIVYDGRHFSSLMLSGAPYGLCGADLAPRYRELDTAGNALTVRFITDNVESANKGFSVVYTSFVPMERRTASDKCFQCQDGSMCIDSGLTCDSLWNCADGSDESFELCSVVPTKQPTTSSGLVGWMGTFLAITVAAFVVLIVAISLVVCCCSSKRGCRGAAAGRGQADGSGGHGVASSAPSSTSNSSSDSSKNSSPAYGEMINRPRNAAAADGPGPYRPDSGRPVESHVFYGYPPPQQAVSGRDMGGMYRLQGGYYPLRKDTRGHSMEHLYGGGLVGHSIVEMAAH